jgi:hypothetical protein
MDPTPAGLFYPTNIISIMDPRQFLYRSRAGLQPKEMRRELRKMTDLFDGPESIRPFRMHPRIVVVP